MNISIPEKLKSRKLWITILGTILAAWKPELIPLLKFLVPSYVIGQGIADSAVSSK